MSIMFWRAYIMGTLCPTDVCFKNSLLRDTMCPNINFDLNFFREKTHLGVIWKEADWLLYSLTNLIHFDSFLRLCGRYWNLFCKAFFISVFLHFYLLWSDLHTKSIRGNTLKIKKCLSCVVVMFTVRNSFLFFMLLLIKWSGKSLGVISAFLFLFFFFIN
jgi:hypothetical protein